eukprot:scaffold27745_cov94-Isochrysis_galbana.AAC.1
MRGAGGGLLPGEKDIRYRGRRSPVSGMSHLRIFLPVRPELLPLLGRVHHAAQEEGNQARQAGRKRLLGTSCFAQRRPELARLDGHHLVGVGRGGQHEVDERGHGGLERLNRDVQKHHEGLAHQPPDGGGGVALDGVEGGQQGWEKSV